MKPEHPSLVRPIVALVRDVAERIPELSHVRAEQVLVVAGEARRASRASVRPMVYGETGTRISADGKREKPRVRIRERAILYVITLRPLWFRASTAQGRVATVIHELYHCAPRFDGTLDPARRHRNSKREFSRKLTPLVRRYLREAPESVVTPFRHSGLVRMPMWLEKPPASLPRRSARGRRVYTEAQLFTALVRLARSGVVH